LALQEVIKHARHEKRYRNYEIISYEGDSMYITKKQTNSKNALCKKILKTNAETPKKKYSR
jgi:hypothetical protein